MLRDYCPVYYRSDGCFWKQSYRRAHDDNGFLLRSFQPKVLRYILPCAKRECLLRLLTSTLTVKRTSF